MVLSLCGLQLNMDFNGRITPDKVFLPVFYSKDTLMYRYKISFFVYRYITSKKVVFCSRISIWKQNSYISMHNYNFASIWQILNSHIDIWGKHSAQNGEKYRYTKNRFLYRYFPTYCPSVEKNPSCKKNPSFKKNPSLQKPTQF